jgi:putative FmdB family regulatory protein
MPIYEYECTKCGHRFEIRHKTGDSDSEIKCPKCEKETPKRVFSVFATSSSGSSCIPTTHSGST